MLQVPEDLKPRPRETAPTSTGLAKVEMDCVFLPAVPCSGLQDLWEPVQKGPSCSAAGKSERTEYRAQGTRNPAPHWLAGKGTWEAHHSSPQLNTVMDTFSCGCDGLRATTVSGLGAVKQAAEKCHGSWGGSCAAGLWKGKVLARVSLGAGMCCPSCTPGLAVLRICTLAFLMAASP